jgi:hypothetical protein
MIQFVSCSFDQDVYKQHVTAATITVVQTLPKQTFYMVSE